MEARNSISNLFTSFTVLFPEIKTKQIFNTGKNNGIPFLDILGYLKNTHKNPKFPDWDLSHSSKFGIFVGFL